MNLIGRITDYLTDEEFLRTLPPETDLNACELELAARLYRTLGGIPYDAAEVLRSQVDTANEDCDIAEAETVRVFEEKQALNKELEGLKRETRRLQDRYWGAERKAKETEAAQRKEIRELKDRLVDLTEKNAQQEVDIAELKEHHASEIKETLARNATQIDAGYARIKELENQIETLRATETH